MFSEIYIYLSTVYICQSHLSIESCHLPFYYPTFDNLVTWEVNLHLRARPANLIVEYLKILRGDFGAYWCAQGPFTVYLPDLLMTYLIK